MAIQITEYSYSAVNGEFVEFTNTGTTAVDMTGYSFDDNTRLAGSFSLSAFGTVNAGESVIITETVDVNAFRTAWGLASNVKVIGGSNLVQATGDGQALQRPDEINLYDNRGALVDRLTYDDATIAGSPRTQNISAYTDPANLGKNDTTKWKLSAVGDIQGSKTSATGGDIGSPGSYLTTAVPVALADIDLSKYVRIGRYDLPEPTRTTAPTGSLLAQEVSGVTYNPDTDTLFVVGDGSTSIVQVSKTGQLIDSMTLAKGASPQGTDFYDLEGIAYIGGGKFVMTEERDRQVVSFTYTPGTTLNRASTQTVKLGTTIGNIGLEGITYDPQTNGYVLVKEATPEGIFQTTINFAAGTASNGSPTSENSINLFDPLKLGVTDIADVYSLSNVTALNGKADSSHLIVLSQESGKIINVDRTGAIFSSLTITGDVGENVPNQSHEGVTVDKNGILYVVSENGGGDVDHPQLWVYAPSTTAIPTPTPTPTPTPPPTPTPVPTPTTGSIFVTEVAPWASGNSPYAADWFEITNTGTTAVDITGWKVDDSSNTFSSAIALNGVNSIAPGQSVVFIETANLAAAKSAFETAWFGSTVPSGFTIGNYSGAGIGLSTGGDEVNIFDASGKLVTGISFGTSTTGLSFDNKAGLGSSTLPVPTVSTLSAIGINGAFLAKDMIETGSPGTITSTVNKAPTAVLLTNLVDRLAENVSTTTRFKVADIAIVDDGLGTNNLTVAGADASAFEIFSNALYIKAGTALSYNTKNSYSVSVNADDTTVGATPDASKTFILSLTEPVFNGTVDADTINGTAGNDTISSGAGNDTITGGAGNDIIFGGTGVDLLFGGVGADVFGFNNANEGIDKINDFEVGIDRIAISRTGFGGDGIFGTTSLVGGGLDSIRFTMGASATTASQRFIYNNNSGALFFDADGSGSAAAQVRIAQLVGNPGLSNNSFTIV
jgi:uncharacterized protein YjiK/Ca2+-binding RTX toxin-like protein